MFGHFKIIKSTFKIWQIFLQPEQKETNNSVENKGAEHVFRSYKIGTSIIGG